jgi:hypothetical protein
MVKHIHFVGTLFRSVERAKSTTWKDASLHKTFAVKGRPIVLLAGPGMTAHVSDAFAEKLAGPFHVYGITLFDELKLVARVVRSLHCGQRAVAVAC